MKWRDPLREKNKSLMEYFVYIMTNEHNTVYYVGVTNDICRRVWEHKTQIEPKSFTARYNVNKLVYAEVYNEVYDALKREKQLKKWNRSKKTELIIGNNPDFIEIPLI